MCSFCWRVSCLFFHTTHHQFTKCSLLLGDWSLKPGQKIPTPSNIPRLNLHTSYHLGFLSQPVRRKWSTRWAWVVGLCGNPLFSSLMGDDFIHSPNWTPGYAAGEQWLQSRAYAEGHEGLRSDGLRAGPLLLDTGGWWWSTNPLKIPWQFGRYMIYDWIVGGFFSFDCLAMFVS